MKKKKLNFYFTSWIKKYTYIIMDKTAALEIAYSRAERKLCVICGTKIIGRTIHVIALKKINLEKVDLPFHPKCYEEDWPKK